MKPKVKGLSLRAILLEQAKEVRDPIYVRFAQLSGNTTKLRAHDRYISGLEDGSEVHVSAQNLADALSAMGAPARDIEGMGRDFILYPDGSFEPV